MWVHVVNNMFKLSFMDDVSALREETWISCSVDKCIALELNFHTRINFLNPIPENISFHRNPFYSLWYGNRKMNRNLGIFLQSFPRRRWFWSFFTFFLICKIKFSKIVANVWFRSSNFLLNNIQMLLFCLNVTLPVSVARVVRVIT